MGDPAHEHEFSVKASQVLLKRAQRVDAMALARPELFFSGVRRIGGYPIYVQRACGPYIWDVDGNKYIDFILGFGSVILGHAHPKVTSAVCDCMALFGGCPTLSTVRQIELAEKIVETCPPVDMVTFLKTGSDATGAAVRLARAVTGRRVVIRWGLNGWHDWCAPNPIGVIQESSQLTKVARFNDLDHIASLFEEHRSDVACVVLMPYDTIPPSDGYLQSVRTLCQENESLFILDEIRSGFRIAMGGAAAYFGVDVDLVTYGKALANGYAISVLAGKHTYMKQLLKVGLTSTFFRLPDSFSAAIATLDELQRIDGLNRIAVLGKQLMDGLDRCAVASRVPFRAVGLPATPFVEFLYDEASRNERAIRLFCNGMLARGVLLSPAHHWFLCTSMSSEDIDFCLDAADAVLLEVRDLL